MKLTPFQKAYAHLLRQERKLSIRRITAMSGMSKSSVHRVCKRNKILRHGDGSKCECRETRRKPGHKPKLNARDKHMLLRTLHIMRRTRRQITVVAR